MYNFIIKDNLDKMILENMLTKHNYKILLKGREVKEIKILNALPKPYEVEVIKK